MSASSSLGTVSLCTPGAIIHHCFCAEAGGKNAARNVGVPANAYGRRNSKPVVLPLITQCSQLVDSGFPHRIQFLLTHMEDFFTCPYCWQTISKVIDESSP